MCSISHALCQTHTLHRYVKKKKKKKETKKNSNFKELEEIRTNIHQAELFYILHEGEGDLQVSPHVNFFLWIIFQPADTAWGIKSALKIAVSTDTS